MWCGRDASALLIDSAVSTRSSGGLVQHSCLSYANLPNPQLWRFRDAAGAEVLVRPKSPLRANNAEALNAGFTCEQQIHDARLVPVLTEWSLPRIAVYLIAATKAGAANMCDSPDERLG
jgi:hypothetical protein